MSIRERMAKRRLLVFQTVIDHGPIQMSGMIRKLPGETRTSIYFALKWLRNRHVVELHKRPDKHPVWRTTQPK